MTPSLLITLTFICAMANAFPILFQRKELEKRLVVTRVHTAPTNTLTDFYSTTTKIVVAPTVEFIISNGVTFTTTLIPAGVDPTAQPAATVTSVIQNKQGNNAVTAATEASSNSVLSTGNSPLEGATTPSTTSATAPNAAGNTPNAATTTSSASANAAQQAGEPQTTSASPNNGQDSGATQTSTTPAATPDATTTNLFTTTTSNIAATTSNTATTSSQGNQNSPTTMAAIGDDVVSASAISQPPAQAHTAVTVATTTSEATSTSEPTTSTISTTSTTSSASTSTISSATSSAASATGVPKALTYSPYNSDGTCRSASDVYNDLQIIKSKGVSQVRIYGTDCNSIETVQPACSKLGIKINQGFWIGSSGADSIDSSVAALIAYGQQSGWDVFEYITIGNEAIISGYCSPSELIGKIQSVKTQLRAAGYNGQVTTSEPPVSFQNHPELCTEAAIDMVGINPHSYFNAQIDASEAGSFVKGQLQLVQKLCGTSNVIITETGYPFSGSSNGLNVPSYENQQIAIQSILEELNGEVTILSYFNDLWKNPGPYGIEQSFGIQSFMQ